jgi:hypothetical protein
LEILKIVCGSKSFLLWVKKHLDKITKCKANICKKDSIWQYQVEGKNVDIILNYLSKIETPVLNRKWKSL